MVNSQLSEIPLQGLSQETWKSKYRLTDKNGVSIDAGPDGTFRRVARAIAEVEPEQARTQWAARFYWALKHGAIPAGRILSNAGAGEHKSATSTINCTVSGTIEDSMESILDHVKEAGLTLRAGCGVGYEFSTLRPKGAFVAGAGASTSGPLSFMDIYDRMCATISSAGGRRGAQMGTFDVGHPDVLDFIRAKREDGRLRQFNLSLLITDEFIEAVKQDAEWKLAFPLSMKEFDGQADLEDETKFVWRHWPVTDRYLKRDDGAVCCKVYKTLPAREIWSQIMTSTYEYAEPGFILIDRSNQMNNNWWCEDIRASNPCVTADTRLATHKGLVRIGDLYEAGDGRMLQVTVDKRALGQGPGTTTRGAVPVFKTSESADVYRVVTEAGYEIKATSWHDFYTQRGKVKLKDLKVGDELLVQSGKGQFGDGGSLHLGRTLSKRAVGREPEVPESIWSGSEECVRGYLQGLFGIDGEIETEARRLVAGKLSFLKDVQRLLANLGVFCTVRRFDEAWYELTCDGELRDAHRFASPIVAIEYAGKEAVFDTTQADHNTVIFNGLVTGQCGEQMLPPNGACLLGSINLTRFVLDPFTTQARFDLATFGEVVRVFTRMLDNVVEINGLPLPEQREEIRRKRRHGMGYLGLGSALAMLGLRYGSPEAVEFTEKVTMRMAIAGWEEALALSDEKGPAPIMTEEFTVTSEMLAQRPEMEQDGFKVGDKVPGRVLHARYSRYMQRLASVAPDLVRQLEERGARFTHHSSIAPTGTIALSVGNNVSNGIEPSFAHRYFRNVIKEGKKTKERSEVVSFELLAYRYLVNANASPDAERAEDRLPAVFVTTDDVTPEQHVAMQAAAQKWVDSSISKTVNVPTDIPFERFKDLYLLAHEKGLKGCTTFRFNPAAFQGVLVKEKDLKETVYVFRTESGEVVRARGDELVEYDGETHTAANLFDALKEGTYGRYA